MNYPKISNCKNLVCQLGYYSQLKHEYGARGVTPLLIGTERILKSALARMKQLPVDQAQVRREPNDLFAIRRLRPNGPRRLWKRFDSAAYCGRIEGALLGRMAGCTLGAPVENWSIPDMRNLAGENGEKFPPTDYWSYVPYPYQKRYDMSPREAYTRSKMNGVPVDDDIAYTLLGLLVVEKFGPNFTPEQNGKAWIKHLPFACTAEKVALDNLKAGIPEWKAGEKDNPYCEWIGADIRSDPWGYMAPGWPEFAADMAYRDAYLSHRRNGIYGEMFFAAAIAAAFAVDDPTEALKIALTEIPRDCALAKAVRWALRQAPRIKNYCQAREAVDRRFAGMNAVHTINNACLAILGIAIGGTDFTKVIGETVAMGLDNDCTAATAGSIVGAVVGKKGIPKHWYKPFHNTVHSYLTGEPKFRIDDLAKRFGKQAEKAYRNIEKPL
ncbi:MAG: ADP-ribosylglycohydrolase family protein [Kiritimatiellia bacterium]|nr:ADP-ribosylglycohydrolase family protein [Kiritimatiellia bacterium]